jgi:dipeptide/tripeptide permease
VVDATTTTNNNMRQNTATTATTNYEQDPHPASLSFHNYHVPNDDENDDTSEDSFMKVPYHDQDPHIQPNTPVSHCKGASITTEHHNHDTTNHNTNNDSFVRYSILSHPTLLYILIMEMAERFAYYGFRAILVLYFVQTLHYDETTAIALYGYNSSWSYLTPLLGAYCADSYWGNRYRTILYFSGLYLLGLFLLTLATTMIVTPSTGAPRVGGGDENDDATSLYQRWLLYQRGLSFLGLFFIGTGTGGIKPCVSSFGADQLVNVVPVVLAVTNTTTTTTTTTTTNHHQHEHMDTTTPDPVIIEQQQEQLEVQRDLSENEEDTDRTSDAAVRVYFNYFYFCINIGAITSIAIIPYIRVYTNSFTYAFGTSFLCMMVALLVFLYRRHQYIILQQPTSLGGRNSMLTTLRFTYQLFMEQMQSYAWVRRMTSIGVFCGGGGGRLRRTRSHDSDAWNDPIRTDGIRLNSDVPRNDALHDDNDDALVATRHSDGNDENNSHSNEQQPMEDARQILHILPILAMFPIYSCLYDQQGSVWTIQATHMYVPPYMQPEQMNMINPLLIMIFIPLFDQMIYPFLQNRCQISIAPLRLMSWGMFLTAMAFTCSGFVDSAIEYHTAHDPSQRHVHVMWQLPQITLLAVGEIFLSVTGLEFAYSQSPTRLKAFVTAMYLSTTGIGDLLAGLLYSTVFSNMKRATVMHVCAIMMLGNLRIFVWVARWYETSTLRHDSYSQVATLESAVDINDVELSAIGLKRFTKFEDASKQP